MIATMIAAARAEFSAGILTSMAGESHGWASFLTDTPTQPAEPRFDHPALLGKWVAPISRRRVAVKAFALTGGNIARFLAACLLAASGPLLEFRLEEDEGGTILTLARDDWAELQLMAALADDRCRPRWNAHSSLESCFFPRRLAAGTTKVHMKHTWTSEESGQQRAVAGWSTL
jgi:hypothetical protein